MQILWAIGKQNERLDETIAYLIEYMDIFGESMEAHNYTINVKKDADDLTKDFEEEPPDEEGEEDDGEYYADEWELPYDEDYF